MQNHTNPLSGRRTTKSLYLTKKRKNLIDKVNNGEGTIDDQKRVEELVKIYEMSKNIKPIEDQFRDVSRCAGSKGILSFAHSGVKYFNALKVLIIGSSGSGKSTNVLNLLAESTVPYRAVHVISPISTISNEVYTTLKYYLEKAGIAFFFTDSDQITEDMKFGDASIVDSNGSSRFLTDIKPSFLIFDDILRSNSKNNPVYDLMCDSAVKFRHRLVSSMYCLQSASFIPSAVSLNYSHLFISGNFLAKDSVWDRLKTAPPDNLDEMISHYNTLQDKRHAFYYMKMDDSILHYYTPYKFVHKQQIITKFKYKIPRGDFSTIDKHKSDHEESESEDIDVVDDATYKKKAADKINKDKITFTGEKIKEEGKRIDKIKQEQNTQKKKKKYVLYNNIKYYL